MNTETQTINMQRAEIIVSWLNRLWAHHKGQQPRVSNDGFNAMALEVQNFSMALSDYLPATVDQAFNTHFLSSQWMPKVADIRKLATLIQSSGEQEFNEYKAWDSFCNALRHESPTSAMPRFHDNKIPQIINDLGGWKHLSQRNEAELQTFIRKDFIQRYNTLRSEKNSKHLLEKSVSVSGLLSTPQGSLNLLGN